MYKNPSSRTRDERPRQKTHRIQLRYIDPTKKTGKEAIFETAFKYLEAPLTKLTDTQSGFYATTDDQQAIDKLTSPKAIDFFKKINLKPVEPPELRSKKTVFVRQVDSSAGGRDAEEIKTELQGKQTWLKIKEIIKIKNYTHVFKIVCNETQMANKILESGLNMFNTRIPPYNCELEEFTHLLVCYRCYQIEKHPTSECQAHTIVCSECAQEGHTWTTCTSEQKRCLNCPPQNNNHRTLAAKCPKRKQAIENKKNQEQHQEEQKKNATYSQIVKETVKQSSIQQQPRIQHLTLTSNLQIKLTALIIEAHIASLSGNGKYNQILEKSLKENFDIDTKFPDRDSQTIFRTYINKNTDTNEDETDDDEDLESHYLPPRQPTPTKNRYSLLDQATLPELPDMECYQNLQLHFEEPRRVHREQRTPVKSPAHRRKSPGKQDSSTRSQAITTLVTRDSVPLSASKPGDHSTIQVKRKTTDETTNQQDESFSLTIYKSSNDPEPTPKNLTDSYVWENINRNDQYGLRITIEKGDPARIMEHIGNRTAALKYNPIKQLPHEEFLKIPRLPTQPPKRVRHSSATKIQQ